MIALGAVLFVLTARSETGKADAGLATGTRAAVGLYHEEVDRARRAVRRLAADELLQRALVARNLPKAERRLRQLARGTVVQAELWSGADESRLAALRGDTAVAFAGTELVLPRTRTLVLTASVTDARDFAARARRLTGLDILVASERRSLASTLPNGAYPAELPAASTLTTLDVAGDEYRGRFVALDAPRGAPVELGILTPTSGFSDQIAGNRLLISILVGLFILLALVAAGFVSRALTGQIATFLAAARRLSRGDFRQLVPLHGGDEFAELGREFNDMSVQLEAKIKEVERGRAELAETIRRVGDALATGLDRGGVVALAVRQAVDACEAEVGRALPLARGAFAGCELGEVRGQLKRAIEAAERDVFAVSSDIGSELLGALEGDDRAERTRRAVSAHGEGVHALSIGLRSLVDGPEYLGAISIARHGRAFSREEEDLLEYLAGQAVVSIENASLHEAIERQAVTDPLTGLANVRAFLATLDHEVERAARFDTPVALIMVDLDDFKRVNDTYGHQQGDEVLARVARALRDVSRELDTVARYGGEELAVILPQTDAAGAELLALRMRRAVEDVNVQRVDGQGRLRVTASFGVAAIPEDAPDRDGLIATADAALYAAKRGGKNRVERAVLPITEPSSEPR
jgi:diguanylate cyclase (GGDEF)-like protein